MNYLYKKWFQRKDTISQLIGGGFDDNGFHRSVPISQLTLLLLPNTVYLLRANSASHSTSYCERGRIPVEVVREDRWWILCTADRLLWSLFPTRGASRDQLQYTNCRFGLRFLNFWFRSSCFCFRLLNFDISLSIALLTRFPIWLGLWDSILLRLVAHTNQRRNPILVNHGYRRYRRRPRYLTWVTNIYRYERTSKILNAIWNSPNWAWLPNPCNCFFLSPNWYFT